MIYWDMNCDLKHESEIRIDGTLAYSEGKFHTRNQLDKKTIKPNKGVKNVKTQGS